MTHSLASSSNQLTSPSRTNVLSGSAFFCSFVSWGLEQRCATFASINVVYRYCFLVNTTELRFWTHFERKAMGSRENPLSRYESSSAIHFSEEFFRILWIILQFHERHLKNIYFCSFLHRGVIMSTCQGYLCSFVALPPTILGFLFSFCFSLT